MSAFEPPQSVQTLLMDGPCGEQACMDGGAAGAPPDAPNFLPRWDRRGKGPCTYDVRKILGILDPPPPCPHFTQPISTVRPQNWPILEPPLPPSVWTSYVHGP